MQSEAVIVTCLNCKQSARIRIMNGNQVMYIDHTPIIACRFRPDMKWGFECTCGNDSRLAPQEEKDVDMLMAGSAPTIIERVLRTLTDKPETKFEMKAA
jgi:hypothetical protein